MQIKDRLQFKVIRSAITFAPMKFILTLFITLCFATQILPVKYLCSKYSSKSVVVNEDSEEDEEENTTQEKNKEKAEKEVKIFIENYYQFNHSITTSGKYHICNTVFKSSYKSTVLTPPPNC